MSSEIFFSAVAIVVIIFFVSNHGRMVSFRKSRMKNKILRLIRWFVISNLMKHRLVSNADQLERERRGWSDEVSGESKITYSRIH